MAGFGGTAARSSVSLLPFPPPTGDPSDSPLAAGFSQGAGLPETSSAEDADGDVSTGGGSAVPGPSRGDAAAPASIFNPLHSVSRCLLQSSIITCTEGNALRG